MLDGSGNPILDGSGNPRTFSVETTIGGSPAANDSFTLFNADGKADNRNATALLELQTKSTVNTGSGGGTSFTSAYASLVERVGPSQPGVHRHHRHRSGAQVRQRKPQRGVRSQPG